jgi:tetratricopeptide (TPR) repeat protein
MRQRRPIIRTVAIMLLLLPCSALAQQQPPQIEKPSIDQINIFEALRNLPCRREGGLGCHDLIFRGRTIEFDVTGQKKKEATTHYSIDMTTLPKVTYEQGVKRSGLVSYKVVTYVKVGGQEPSPEVAALFEQASGGFIDGNLLAAILNRVHTYSLYPKQPLMHFSKDAAAWRALPQKPPMSEEGHARSLLADEAVSQGKPYMALHYYESALEYDPMWPAGYYNAALLSAATGNYAMAMQHMGWYLELMPDAPDAQAARDRISMWKVKSQEK